MALELPNLGVGKGSTSRTQAYASVLVIDVKSIQGIKNKAMMGCSTPHLEIVVPGASPEMGSTKTDKDAALVEKKVTAKFGESMVFLLTPGMDELVLTIKCPGKMVGFDEMGTVCIKAMTVFDQVVKDFPLQPEGTVSLGVQLMPLQETLWLPQQIAATKTQVENWTQRAKTLEAQLVLRTQEKVALQAALDASGEEADAAKAAAAATIAANEAEIASQAEAAAALEASMADLDGYCDFLEANTNAAKAQAAMDGAKALAGAYAEQGKALAAAGAAMAAEYAGKAGELMSGLKGKIGAAKETDAALNPPS